MKPWVGRILLLLAVILLIISFLSASNLPSKDVTVTKTYFTQESQTFKEVTTSSDLLTFVHEETSYQLIIYSTVRDKSVTLKAASLLWDLKARAPLCTFIEHLEDLKVDDEISVFLEVPAHIQIIGVKGKATEIYSETALHHRIQYDGDYIVRIDLNEDKCNSIQKPVEVIINVFRPISGTLEIVTETIQRTNTYTTTSYRESIYSLLYTDVKYNPVEISSVRKQSLLPNWLMLPFIVIAVGLISAFLVLRQQRVNRSLTNLGVLLLEDKYFPKEELLEKPVFNSRGMRIGQVMDVGYSINGKVALVVRINKDKEKIIPFTQIEEIGDIVLLSPEAEKIRERKDFRGFRKTSQEISF